MVHCLSRPVLSLVQTPATQCAKQYVQVCSKADKVSIHHDSLQLRYAVVVLA